MNENENESVGFDDFESALFGGDYQTDAERDDYEDEQTDTTEDDDAADEDIDTEDDASEDDADEQEEEPDGDDSEAEAEGQEEPADKNDAAQTFTLKVNKEERTVTLEEMTALAQKGADYDRVKEQNAKSQQTIQQLQSELSGFSAKKDALDVLDIVAAKTGTSLDQLAEMLYISVRKSAGASEDVAKEELKSAKLEKELNGIKAQQAKPQQQQDDAESRAKRELEAFGKEYPDVKLTDELVNKLAPDLKNGISLTAAYRKLEKAEAEAKIRDLEQQLAAKKQNAENKKRSPGSQKDSGGRRSRNDYEEFEWALFN